MLEGILQSFELNPKEIKLFMKLVELGSQPASHLSRVCELPRNTVRSILDKLVQKGLIVKTVRSNTQYYSNEKRENIIRMLKAKKVRIQAKVDRQIDLLQTYGDELDLRHHSKSRPKITFYEGLSGLKKVYEDTLTAKNGLRSWASYDHLLDVMPDFFGDYFKTRANKKIKMRSIHPDTKAAKIAQKRDKIELRESALIPYELFEWQPEIQIYNNKLNITSWKERLAIIIESEEIAKAMTVIFDLAYQEAKQYKQFTEFKGRDI